MSFKQLLARSIASGFLAGPWSLEELIQRGVAVCGRRQRWLSSLAGRVYQSFSDAHGLTRAKLARFISEDAGFSKAYVKHRLWKLPWSTVLWETPVMESRPKPASAWEVPPLPTRTAVPNWLGLGPGELDWFADCQSRAARSGVEGLRHYSYQWMLQRGGKSRLLEAPKARLKAIQRRLLHEILDRIPVHDAVHGYRRGRSIASFAAPHCGQAIVLRFDLCDFFPSIRASRVHALFRTAGYPEDVAQVLTGLCTNVVPAEVMRRTPRREYDTNPSPSRDCFRRRHLPQGAPTSPALANLCAYRLDCRLAGLARALDARYTRYADDLAFSGGEIFERGARRFQIAVARIALEEDFAVRTTKSRFMRQAVRQQLAGVVVNAHLNITRTNYDRLKAILCNCVRYGPASQNREARTDFHKHLEGQIAYISMINPARGERLKTILEKIVW
jgi:hypothetical protein